MKLIKPFIQICFLVVFLSCSNQGLMDKGIWKLQLHLGQVNLPFTIDVQSHDTIWIQNDVEEILCTDVQYSNDSVHINFPFFNSSIHASITDNSVLSGYWVVNDKENYKIPVSGTSKEQYRFDFDEADVSHAAAGRWRVTFSPETENESVAVGIFNQEDVAFWNASGTFRTPTGDYRFLDGVVRNDSLLLSVFDGAHAFLFKAHIVAQDTLKGTFWSGKHWQEPWIAVRDDSFELPDPDTMTYLKAGYDKLKFTFPDLDSQLVSLSDYDGKPVIVQIMGTWCPNCLDESRFLAQYYDQSDSDLEIIGLAFERSKTFEGAKFNIEKLQGDVGINYKVLIAGPANKKEAAKQLPMLNKVISYPTTIFINRTGDIVRIHTGFNGPATKEKYYEFIESFDETVQQILKPI